MFCNGCGKPNPEGAKFCNGCGNPVNEGSADSFCCWSKPRFRDDSSHRPADSATAVSAEVIVGREAAPHEEVISPGARTRGATHTVLDAARQDATRSREREMRDLCQEISRRDVRAGRTRCIKSPRSLCIKQHLCVPLSQSPSTVKFKDLDLERVTFVPCLNERGAASQDLIDSWCEFGARHVRLERVRRRVCVRKPTETLCSRVCVTSRQSLKCPES